MPDPHENSIEPTSHEIQVISTGSLRLDVALGLGGFVRSNFIEFSGPESSGKTTLALHIISEAQKLGGVCALIDADHSLDTAHARRCGVDLNNLYVSQPAHTGQALEMLEVLVNSGSTSVIVLDSITSLITQEELFSPLGAEVPDTSQTMLAKTLRRLPKVMEQHQTTVLFVIKTDLKRGPVYHNLAANTARMALQLMAAQRLKFFPVRMIRDEGKIVGNTVQVNVIKNQFYPCYQTAELDIMYNDSIEKAGEIFDLGTQLRIIDIEQSTFYYQGLKLGRKRQEAVGLLKANRALADEIEQVIRQKLLTTGLDLIA